jgi:alkylation response protein AidB-like acyl-CoA dehydrogenase
MPEKTKTNIEANNTPAGCRGVSMPRRFGGLNLPITVFSMLSELVSAGPTRVPEHLEPAERIDTLYEFGLDGAEREVYPRASRRRRPCPMDLTEPDAGFRLQRVMLKARQDEDGTWRLNGVEADSSPTATRTSTWCWHARTGRHEDGRGLSMFIYDKRRRRRRRASHRAQRSRIHGKPHLRAVYKNAKAELCGDRPWGLIKYVRPDERCPTGHCRTGVGLEQEAYNEALAYAKDRHSLARNHHLPRLSTTCSRA